MTRLVHVRRLALLAFGALGIAVACRTAAPEGQPMGPRPGPVEPSSNPVPGVPDPTLPGGPGPTFPTPDAPPASPGPISSREVPTPSYQAAAEPAQIPRDAGVDAVMSDATTLPPIGDAMPTDAARTLQP